MTLFNDQGGQSGAVTANLFTISRCDGNVGDTSVSGDTTVTQVTYAGAAPAAQTAARLFALVNTNFGTPIVITALNGGIDPHSGIDVTGNGVTYVDSSSGSNVVRVVYDMNQCNGSGIFAFDINGNQITFPNVPLLYHELSHAFRAAQGTTQSNDEIPAETDENVMRGALGLCLRNVNDHGGGCGSGNNCGGTVDDCGVGDGSGGGCLIVTATTGSPFSAEVVRLRALRDRVGRASALGSQLIDVIYREYFQFSPSIAARLQHDVIAKEVVLQIVVRPLLAWYSLASTLAFERKDRKTIKRAVQTMRVACPPNLSSTVVAMLEEIRSGKPLPADAPRMLRDFAPKLQEVTRLRYASWAILDPLSRAWTLGTQDFDEADVAGQVAEWLAGAPLEVVTPPGNRHSLDKELRVLESFFSFKPQARKHLGQRLALAWPEATGALKRHGFM